MTNSLLKWHLAHDNQVRLARFCAKHKVSQDQTVFYEVDGVKYFSMCFRFDNGGYINAEGLVGTETQSYNVADHFQVINYSEGL